MRKSELEQIKEVLAPMIPIGRVERLAAIAGLVLIDIYALSQGINSGLTIAITGLIGGVAGYALGTKRNM